MKVFILQKLIDIAEKRRIAIVKSRENETESLKTLYWLGREHETEDLIKMYNQFMPIVKSHEESMDKLDAANQHLYDVIHNMASTIRNL